MNPRRQVSRRGFSTVGALYTLANRYLKIAFSHAAVRAIQYFPEIKSFYQKQCRRKPKPVARGIVAKELGKIVYYVLSKGEAYNGTFKGKLLTKSKQPEWPRKRSPDA